MNCLLQLIQVNEDHMNVPLMVDSGNEKIKTLQQAFYWGDAHYTIKWDRRLMEKVPWEK